MSRVLTFSRTFPAYHPRKGEPTLFVQQIWQSIGLPSAEYYLNFENDVWWGYRMKGNPKHHTIRAGNRWKVGDKFSPRVWSGKPYASKQIIIAPDIEVKSVQEIKIEVDKDYVCILIDNWPFFEENKNMVTQIEAFETLAKNDGLTLQDMKDWFKYPKAFTGQIICWNEKLKY